jgi:uncharacterized damage-inducible protein DinB
MSEIDLFHRLFAHLEWADARTFDVLRGAPTAPPPRVLELCAHISGAELNWLARIQGRTPAAPVWPTPTMDDCAKVMRIAHDGWRKYVAALTKDELARVVHYKNSAGAEFDSRVDDILLHVSMHGMNHRGQVNAQLRAAGIEPSSGDYIAFARGVPAATRQPG